MIRVNNARLLSLAILTALSGCSGGGGASDSTVRTGGDFVVLKTEPSDNGALFLNDPIRVDFSNNVDLSSVDLTTFSFQVLDQVGSTVAEPVAGNFELATSPGDAVAGRRLLFVPRLPTNDLYTNGGFRPGRTYVAQLVGGSVLNGTMMRDRTGRGLAVPRTFRFSTSDGTTPSQLFRNTAPGGPRRAGLQISPTPDTTGVVLNKRGAPPVEIRLVFDQPLNPSSVNVPIAVDTNPLTRSGNNRGRIFLEYDDPDVTIGNNTWIPAEIELESNTTTSSSVIVRPLGVLPNNAVVRVVVERTLEDISGESNVSNAAYERVFGTFRTKRAYEQQFDSLVDDFLAAEQVDLTAAFAEPVAEVGPGYLKAGFDFEGSSTGADFEPVPPETILNTDFTQVTPKNGAPFNVSGGVFNFRSVRIPAGKVVQGQGSNPMVWLVSERFEVAGTLSVRGGNGTRVTTTGNADVPKAGGAGVCGGGDGGAGSPSPTARDLIGGTGNGPRQLVGGGGLGGILSCAAGCGRGSGGGGGSFATQGDPNFKQKTVPAGGPTGNIWPIFPQQAGIGGNGCIGASGVLTRNLLGSAPGPLKFVDARNDNNFWGVGVRFDGNPLRITGELTVPVGGAGGGGGGDYSDNNNCNTDDVNFQNDASGGGGGGGGGVLIVKCLGPIVVSAGGSISADGGSGGGGAQSGSSSRGGGGGGGAGGMVVLMSAVRIEINARGVGSGATARFLYGAAAGTDRDDFNFSISADGGACTTLNFQAPIITQKYQTTGATIPAAYATTYDAAPLGGFGGLGVVQLMAPPGDNADGTNTRLDDNIVVFRDGVPATPAQKQALLGWRGYPNQLGQGVPDIGTTLINIGDNEGDIRPSPILLPTPFAAKTRLRSKWIDTGATARRRLDSDDNQPRGIVDPSGLVVGPRFEFSGYQLDAGNVSTGYAAYELVGSSARSKFATSVAATAILVSDGAATYQGRPAYRIELVDPVLGDVVDRFAGYQAELLGSTDQVIGGFRILAHTNRELFLATEAGALPAGAAKLQVKAKFFELVTNGVEGPNQTYQGALGRVPVANVKIGFAFHTNPASATAARFPAAPGTFTYDLSDPAVQEQIRTLGGTGASFVQWDVLFDTAYESVSADEPLPLRPETPRPELRFLRVPFRF